MEALLSLYNKVDLDIGQQALFDSARAAVGNDHMFYVLGLALTHSVTFYGVNTCYGILTRVLGDKVERLRYQSGKHPKPELVRKCILYVTLWHLLAPLLPFFLYPSAISYHPTMMTDPVPGVLTILLQVIVSYIFTDFLFYWGHRLLHWGPLYRSIHKQHHSFYVSIGFAAEYAHPVELLFCNVFPVVFACVAFKFHFATFCIWNTIALWGTVSGHSGVTSPWAKEDGFHDFHHSHNVGNFGSMPYWDKICGTDKAWRKFKAETQGQAKKVQ